MQSLKWAVPGLIVAVAMLLPAQETQPARAQSRFKLKTKEGTMVVDVYQPSVSFTLDELGVLIVEGAGLQTITVGVAEGNTLLVQQGDVTVEAEGHVRLKRAGGDLLQVNLEGAMAPLAFVAPPPEYKLVEEPTPAAAKPADVVSPVAQPTVAPPRVKIVE